MNSISRLIQAARIPRSVVEADLMENKCYPNVGQLLITYSVYPQGIFGWYNV